MNLPKSKAVKVPIFWKTKQLYRIDSTLVVSNTCMLLPNGVGDRRLPEGGKGALVPLGLL